MEIPKEFLDRMHAMLQEEGEWQSFLRSFSEMPKRGIRVNRKKVEEAEKEGFSFQEWKEKWHLEPVFSEKREEEQREFYVEEEELRENGISIGKDPYHEGGLYYIQDPSAMAVVPRMEIRPFDRCLDLCASPGGKSLQIADLLSEEEGGILLSNEYVGERARILSQNAERMGYCNLAVVNESPVSLADNFPSYFSRILVDAPCSGEGMFRKSEEAVKDWSPFLVEKCAERQRDILKSAFQMLREGGELCYSTCTFAPLEDEEMRDWILRENPDYSLKEEKKLLFHNSRGEGQYYAIFKKAGKDLERTTKKEAYSILRKNKSIFIYSSGLEPFSRLKLFRLGVRAFEEGKTGWEYSHGLSHALHLKRLYPVLSACKPETKYNLRYCIYLKRGEKRVDAYLSGQEIHVKREECSFFIPPQKGESTGLGIVYCDGIPLGFGYYRNEKLRNLYPKGLRYRS